MTTTDRQSPPGVGRAVLRIARRAAEQIHAWAREAGRDECMGLLAAPASRPVGKVTAAIRLPAAASAGHAEASPLAIAKATEYLRQRGLLPVGLWHSHGALEVFHSHTDDNTVVRLLPAMAEALFRGPRPNVLAPTVVGPDRAVLPLPDGRLMTFTLLGPEAADTGFYERACWAGASCTFDRAPTAPRAVQRPGVLRLGAGGVWLSLVIPEGATITSRAEDVAPWRAATLFSLVVNRRGDSYAEALEVVDVGGRTLMEKKQCPVDVVEPAGGCVEAAAGAVT